MKIWFAYKLSTYECTFLILEEVLQSANFINFFGSLKNCNWCRILSFANDYCPVLPKLRNITIFYKFGSKFSLSDIYFAKETRLNLIRFQQVSWNLSNNFFKYFRPDFSLNSQYIEKSLGTTVIANIMWKKCKK